MIAGWPNVRLVVLGLLVLPLLLCPIQVQSQETVDSQAVASIPDGDKDAFAYSPRGRRDPFRPLVQKETVAEEIVRKKEPTRVKGPLEKFELSQYRLMAIVVVEGAPRGMVKAPNGKSYTVKVDDYIGLNGGQVSKIETKAIDIDQNGMRIEKNPDRIVVEEVGINSLTGEEVRENRYIAM